MDACMWGWVDVTTMNLIMTIHRMLKMCTYLHPIYHHDKNHRSQIMIKINVRIKKTKRIIKIRFVEKMGLFNEKKIHLHLRLDPTFSLTTNVASLYKHTRGITQDL